MSKIFEPLKQEVVKDILRNCDFTTKVADSIIIKQGDRGDCFYVILNGTVSIYVNTDAGMEESDRSSMTESTADGNDVVPKIDRSKFGNLVLSLGPGKSFGELALINKDCIRNASVIADEPTELIVLSRELFARSIKSLQEADLKARHDFVNSSSLFTGWKPNYKKQAAMSLRREVYTFDSVLIKQGEPVNGLMFIGNGQVKYICDPFMHETQYPEYNLQEFNSPEAIHKFQERLQAMQLAATITHHIVANSPQSEAEEKSLMDKFTKSLIVRQEAATEKQQNAVDAQKHRTLLGPQGSFPKRTLDFAIVGAGETIGELEMAMDLPTYAQTAVCMQTTEILLLETRNYERLVAKRNQAVLKTLRENTEMKLIGREIRLAEQTLTIPLVYALIHSIELKKKKKK